MSRAGTAFVVIPQALLYIVTAVTSALVGVQLIQWRYRLRCIRSYNVHLTPLSDMTLAAYPANRSHDLSNGVIAVEDQG
jgi:predicted house-cleaning NTP pyrophosphatase (Maf/HAM1 superfamily)